MTLLAVEPAPASAMPRMIAYCAQPNPYFNQRAADIAQIYDGFFFTIGSWDEGVIANLGLAPDLPPTTDWKERARENLVHLRRAGVTENLLGVHFGQDAPWPSPETLLCGDYRAKLARHFAAIGRAARELGFRGVSIDIEYPYKRYSLDHQIYTYDGYRAEDLLAAAGEQGRAVMGALLDEFADAVVFLLPGELWNRPIARAFSLAMLRVMAERDAPGGLHLGYERSYCLYDPVSQAAIPRVGDCAARALLDDATLDYWKRRCTVAPGVWPLHMVETGGEGYPVRSWSEELAELEQQLQILRAVAKRYMWSFSANPVWYLPRPEIAQQYGLPLQSFDSADQAIGGWQRILAQPSEIRDPRIRALLRAIAAFDREEITCAELCNRFGTPAQWAILGPLGNPFTSPQYAALGAILRPVDYNEPVHGRDGVVRWFVFPNHEPLGAVRLQAAFDWRNTDDCAAHLVSMVRARRDLRGYLNLGWDDGIAVWLNDKLVLDRRAYPPEGHGMLYRDRYLFEERVPVAIPKGDSRLAVTCINSHGAWGFNLRFSDAEGFPLRGLTFYPPPRP